ncbi:hypothetical protein [Methylobacterium indicum]|uniref:hypothetical protein n=1 Tax=Methylobacterium indicum TaxID=1775910 RepID=UPI002434EA4A|nr:hypothetical protein [Methylobacterium indicum]
MSRHCRIFADYHQIYLWDHGVRPDAPTDYTDADTVRRIKAAPFVVVIQPERNTEVPVAIEVVRTAPPLDLDRWDHVAEASLALPSGRLEIHECTGGSVDILSVPPGTYRVRTAHGGLATIDPDGLDGRDHYRIVLWPAPVAEIAILKQYTGPRDAP